MLCTEHCRLKYPAFGGEFQLSLYYNTDCRFMHHFFGSKSHNSQNVYNMIRACDRNRVSVSRFLRRKYRSRCGRYPIRKGLPSHRSRTCPSKGSVQHPPSATDVHHKGTQTDGVFRKNTPNNGRQHRHPSRSLERLSSVP